MQKNLSTLLLPTFSTHSHYLPNREEIILLSKSFKFVLPTTNHSPFCFSSKQFYQQFYTLSPSLDTLAILYVQHHHRSTAIWEGRDTGVLMIQHHYHIHKLSLDELVRPSIIIDGLHGVSCLRTIRVDHRLVTELVNGWNLETSHLPPSNWRGHHRVAGCCRPSRIED